MDLSTVHQGVHKHKRKKRVGRGIGSGHGKTATRGSKGQCASAGAEMSEAAVRRRPDAALPPHPQARLQPRHLGQVPSTSSTSATSTPPSTTAPTVDAGRRCKAKGCAKGTGRRRPHPRHRRADQEADRPRPPLLASRPRRRSTGQGRHGRGHPAAEEAGPQQDEAAAAARQP